MDDLRNKLTQEVSGTILQAQQNVVQRVKERMENLYQRLNDPKAVFRDSTVENLTELLALVPHLVAGDVLPSSTRDTLDIVGAAFSSLDAEALRNNAAHRASTAIKLKELLGSL